MNAETPIDLHTLRVTRAIADHGSVTAAAAALGYSQPAVSQHLRRAERRLGTPLVLRDGRGVRLTEPGQVLARHARTILAGLEAAADELSRMVDRAAGTVRVAGFPSVSSTIVPRFMARLAGECPDVQIAYTEAEPPEALEMLADGRIDLAITFRYPGDGSDPHTGLTGMATLALFDDPVVVALPRTHPLDGRDAVALDELSEARWIAGCPLCRGHLLAACTASGFTPHVAHATDNVVAVLGLVQAGLGVALLPDLALLPLDVPPGVGVHPTRPAESRQVNLIHRAGADQVPAVREAVRVLVAAAQARRARR
ncbi:LysR family transcriptional regulator [Propionicicella superfundia]|uniref:LysR family transcriptional regulator n=1 Tax=Propionicicella superfundia TaxID=348582 RepID=UPI00042A087F|nr:LysR family transcriptional regulator [Propionicicella superfundia]